MKKQLIISLKVLMPLLFVMMVSCKKDSVNTSEKIPVVSTKEVTEIRQNSALSGGEIISDGGFSVTSRGVCWSVNPNPTIKNDTTIDGAGGGSFTSILKSLIPDTTYFVRSYATNEKGTSYGLTYNFRTLKAELALLTTNDVTNIDFTTATCGGRITFDGGLEISVRGVCWTRAHSNPTISNDTTVDGDGTGFYKSHLTGLVPNTTYKVRAYAINDLGVSYGQTKTFKTLREFTVPSVATSNVTSITSYSAIIGGSITDDGGAYISERGVLWSKEPNPSFVDSVIVIGNGSGNYSITIFDLEPLTTYFLKAYAINNFGIGYGSEVQFTTLANTCITFADSRDGIPYTTVQIGHQCWMKENLKWLPEVSPSENGSQITPYFYVYGYEGYSVSEAIYTENYQTYGVLYNWPAAINACPDGWHLPSYDEWMVLADYLGGSSMAGGKMKTTGTIHWNSPNTGATNSSGFSGLPGGNRAPDDWFAYFGEIGDMGGWWSSTLDINTATPLLLLAGFPSLNSTTVTIDHGFSVRCVKD